MLGYTARNRTNHTFCFNRVYRRMGSRCSSGDIHAGYEAVMWGKDPLLRASVGWDAHSAANSL